MKKKELEILLQKTPNFAKPKANLEQYLTPASIAADIVYNAYHLKDIENKTIIDLGCGTGIFSIGAYLTGAKKVTGIDVDKESIEIAKKYAEENNYNINFLVKKIEDIDMKCDTIIMNPPFGAQKSNKKADRRFIEKAFESSSVFYSLHLTETLSFIEKIVESLKGEITHIKKYDFPIKHTFSFHKKQVVNYNISMIRVTKKGKKSKQKSN